MKTLTILLTTIFATFTLTACTQTTKTADNQRYYSADSQRYAYNQKSQQPLSDTAITTKVKTAFVNEKLFGNKSVSPMSIHVRTINNVVYLTGTADSQTEINNAVSIAKSIDGVNRVISKVTVAR